jgi:hypothetical protein
MSYSVTKLACSPKITEHPFLGLPDLLGPPDLSLAMDVQELPQAAPHIQAAHGLLRDRHSPH